MQRACEEWASTARTLRGRQGQGGAHNRLFHGCSTARPAAPPIFQLPQLLPLPLPPDGQTWDHEAALDIGATVDLSQGLEAGEGEGLGVEDELAEGPPG